MSTAMREAFIRQRRNAAQAAIRAGKRILVLGVMPGNLPPELRKHPLVDHWQGDVGIHRKTIPSDTGLVLMTRFLDHSDAKAITQQAERRGIDCTPTPLNTGELRAILQDVAELAAERGQQEQRAKANGNGHNGTHAAPSLPAPAAEQQAKKALGRGQLREFIEEFADLDAPSQAKEAERLMPIAEKLGLSTTLDSVKQGLYTARMRRAVQPPPKEAPKPEPVLTAAPAPVIAVPPEAPADPVPPSAHVATAAPGLSHDEQDVLKLFDDAIASMQLARERFTALLERQRSSVALKQQLMELANRL